jgi:hypothetical protein
MNTPSNPTEKRTPEERLLVFLTLAMTAGVILSCVFEYFSMSGSFQRWERVGRVPENAKEVIGGSPVRAYIRTSENKTLGCALNNGEECWIPAVYEDPFYTQPCNQEDVAFSSAIHPPQNITSCIETDTGGGGYSYDVIYVTDQDHNLWRWALVQEGNETPLIMIMMMVGAVGGVLIGTILWVILRLFQKRRLPRKSPLFSKTQLVFLAIPWLCFLSFQAYQYLASQWPAEYQSPEVAAENTEVANTETARKTRVAKEFLIQVTPGAGRVRYSFSDHPCDAEWNSGQEVIPCLSDPDLSGPAVSIQSASTIGGKKIEGQAVLVPTGSFDYVYGEYPTIEIQAGDHFKATIACLTDSPDCNMDFDVYLQMLNRPGIHLGAWSPKGENRIEEINLDLTKFAGRRVRFAFVTSKDDYKKAGQDIVWILPKIEK